MGTNAAPSVLEGLAPCVGRGTTGLAAALLKHTGGLGVGWTLSVQTLAAAKGLICDPIKWSTGGRSRKLLIPFHSALTRPHLAEWIQSGVSRCMKAVGKPELIHRRAHKMAGGWSMRLRGRGSGNGVCSLRRRNSNFAVPKEELAEKIGLGSLPKNEQRRS